MPSDLFSLYVEYSEGSPSPEIFRQWAAIAMISGAAGRRIMYWSARGPTFPIVYVLLMARPGIGKAAIDDVNTFWTEARPEGSEEPSFHVMPDSVTKASLVDELSESGRMFYPPVGQAENHHSLLIAAEEFGVLLPKFDEEIITMLNFVWTCKPSYRERRRTSTVKRADISFPHITMLAGYQPALMNETFPESYWSSGLSRRIIMIYADETPFVDLWHARPQKHELKEEILRRLAQIGATYGQAKVPQDAQEFIRHWDAQGSPQNGPNRPRHSRLEAYCQSRTQHVMRLALISSISRGLDLVVTVEDFQRAVHWLTSAERVMPDIFRSMKGTSDISVIEELRLALMGEWARNKSPMSKEFVYNFCANRLPSYKIDGVIKTAIDSGYIATTLDGDFLPRFERAGIIIE